MLLTALTSYSCKVWMCGSPWWFGGWDLALSLLGPWVWSLFWELRSHKPCSQKKKKQILSFMSVSSNYHLPFQHSSYLLRYVSLITVFRVIFQPLRLEVLIAQMLNHLCLTAVSVHFLILGDFFLILKSIPLLASNSWGDIYCTCCFHFNLTSCIKWFFCYT